MQEWIVTLHKKEDLEEFYYDMETPGGDLYIPDRAVDLVDRRPISRNTHYMLSDEEAEQLRKDERVLDVQPLPSALGIKVIRAWEQTSNFEKSTSIDSNDKNWGLYRVTEGATVANWGRDATTQISNRYIATTSSGKNVDVVIVDAHINPNHPEFAVNPDGSGGSRVNLIDWFGQYASLAGLSVSGAYEYSAVSSNHGTHVAGTACGNTQGWARDSNIYNMEFGYAGSNAPLNWELRIFDLIRAFHENKPINPATGRRNPTITNHSWGYSYGDIPLSALSEVYYRGTAIPLTGTDAQKKATLELNGVPVPANTYLNSTPYTYPALNADVEDAIADGVIVVCAAGNSYWNVGTPSSSDWNNYVLAGGSSYISTARGMSPGAPNTGAIVVGNISAYTNEVKRSSSNFGAGIDIWAPGSHIVSAVYDTSASGEFGIVLANDPRNSIYKLGSISGTSMASPQVCGLLACYAEQNPGLTQEEAKQYLIDTSLKDEVGSSGSDYGDYFWFGDEGNNRYLYYKKHRPLEGAQIPRGDFKNRPLSGKVYPRQRVRRRG